MPGPPHEPPLDLHTLLGQFTALRHEVHLQTRSLRAQQEVTTETLRQYGHTLEMLETAQTAEYPEGNTPEDEVLRPFLKHLVDARDALALARTQVERVGDALQPLVKELTSVPGPGAEGVEPPDQDEALVRGDLERPRTFFQRLFGGSGAQTGGEVLSALRHHRQALQERDQRLRRAAEVADRVQLAFDSIRTGYTMSVQRLERTLDACGLEPISSVGRPFDPELMEVVEVAMDTGRPANEVVEEVRPGYLWHGRVFRYAQVRVAKP